MAMLLGDVGGTNARLAIARNGLIDQATVTRFRGDDFASFDDVVRQFMAEQHQPNISAMCVAVAGPVSGGRARLTNRDWSFDENDLARLTDADHVRLINDLTALGYATPALTGGGISILREAPADRARNGQALVVGLGTGFNVCAVRVLPGGAITALEAEEGHTHLPANIMARLIQEVGPVAAADFFSTEETFAGRGLSRLHAAMTGTPPVRSEDIARAMEAGDPAAIETYDFFTELVGLLCRELSLRFMPFEGLFLAGSVGRSIADRMDRFTPAFLSETHMGHIPANTPIHLILDDMAALHGCLAALA
ncbi:glucokinase [Paracoccus sp. 1_MG-2023]|uniref:glucokinase n=1 Tax=unclassified Paracoccus (in: a-proteobacteria) TaxID=2688777 RepID=UPI001C07F0F6|nr:MULTISPECIES: glucokinase [unclassified Paracoccus (in: a-proteobacteria)]MBU2957208.1 glucokinase [Paracoccus sp. C2R09]MDO6669095.1 glucokinase [Paracoccus sp. 1_MG-2023]